MLLLLLLLLPLGGEGLVVLLRAELLVEAAAVPRWVDFGDSIHGMYKQ